MPLRLLTAQAMKDRHKLKSKLFKKQPYHFSGCD